MTKGADSGRRGGRVDTHLPGSTDSPEDRGSKIPRSFSFPWGLVLKLLFLGAINLLAVWSIPSMWSQRWWPGLIAVVGATILIDWAYLSPRTIPAKYLVPGTIFALIFAVVPVIYNAFIAFTNYGTGNVLTREQAVDNIGGRVSNVPGSSQFGLKVLADDDGNGEFALLLEDDAGNQLFGTSEGAEELAPEDVTLDADGNPVAVGDYVVVNLGQIADRQDELAALEVPTDQGVVKIVTLSSAAVYEPLFLYDEETGTFTDNETGTEYVAIEGTFTAADGTTITPGYRAYIGWDNFTKIVTSEAIRGPFLRVFIWNYVFAISSVAITFAVGLGLAIALNQEGLRGKRIYRSLLIIPYALPSFMTALIWQGMLNQSFGVINDMLNANIPWLRDPTMAKISILLVNLWLGFPYMFLISTGALQAIPAELKEAARVDGARAGQIFRAVTFPLLLVTLAPLLIASFAFNFNNFNTIFLLTGGGPPIAGAQTPAGHTDILISYTYRLAFQSGGGADFGFAAAIASLIFIMVATISALSFRRTRVLEELN